MGRLSQAGPMPAHSASSFSLKVDGILPMLEMFVALTLFFCLMVYALLIAPSEPQQKYAPVIVATLGWAALHYSFLFMQSASAFWVHNRLRLKGGSDQYADFIRTKYASPPKGLIFFMDRAVGNLLEQTPPFLTGLWLHAVFA